MTTIYILKNLTKFLRVEKEFRRNKQTDIMSFSQLINFFKTAIICMSYICWEYKSVI